jgi:4-diphosphocytidyl-2-C-methyl-D-erythritol kinase
MSSASLAIAAPAKVNLTLAILGGRRPDGYHELHGVFARLALADRLAVLGLGEPDGPDLLRVSPRGDGRAEGVDIVLRAVAALRAWAGRPLSRLELALRKRIPVAAGLGGGSSDGAAALRLAAAAWRIRVPAADRAAIALDLGADVPFFLGRSPVSLVGGRGERVAGLPPARAAAGVLLVCRPGKPSTAAVFAAHDALPAPAVSRALRATARLAATLRSRRSGPSLAALAPELRDANDLYRAACVVMPWLADWRSTVEGIVGRPALLSGAGPTLAVLYASAGEAGRARRTLERALGPARLPDGVRLIATTIAAEGREDR